MSSGTGMTSTGGTIATVQNMKVSSLCNSQSDLRYLGLVAGAHASVTSCLNTIGRNVACFMRLLADKFDRAASCRAHSLWLCQLSRQDCFLQFLETRPPAVMTP